MSLKICSLASGSKGNCCFVSNSETTVLIDLGITNQRIFKSLEVLGQKPENVNILVTHAHSDHICGIEAFVNKYDVPVYCPSGAAKHLRRKESIKRNLIEVSENEFFIGNLIISPFKVSHDIPCMGYGIMDGKKKISVVTDLGEADESVLDNLSDSALVMLEANHDVDLLLRNPNYHYQLKRRILSQNGHLSNSDCADAVLKLYNRGVKNFILAHLSQENNYPELALSTVNSKLEQNGIFDALIEAACQDAMTGLYEVG